MGSTDRALSRLGAAVGAARDEELQSFRVRQIATLELFAGWYDHCVTAG